MGSTLGALLDRQAARLVGRDRERAALLRLVSDDVPVAMFVHGLAGVGKSALLAAFSADARERGAAVVSLDGRAIEPTERGFLDALAARLGGEPGPLAQVAAALGAQATRTVLAIDHYEALTLLDDWIRQVLLPSRPRYLPAPSRGSRRAGLGLAFGVGRAVRAAAARQSPAR